MMASVQHGDAADGCKIIPFAPTAFSRLTGIICAP